MIREFIFQVLSTQSGWTGLVLRLTLGIVLYPHAVQKLFGWFNGPGLAGEMHFMTKVVHLPAYVAMLAIFVECGGMLLLFLGLGTRLAAIALFAQFIGMVLLVHFKNGFFMNWFGQLPAGGEGFEFHLLVFGLCVGIFLEGGGFFSIDRWITSR